MPAEPALRRRPSWKFSLFMALAQKTAHYLIRGTADRQTRIDFSLEIKYILVVLIMYIYVHCSAVCQF